MTGIHHDLRAPVAAVEGYARILLDGRAGPLGPKQASYVEAIVASCRVLVHLVEAVRLGAAAADGGAASPGAAGRGAPGPAGGADRILERVAAGLGRAFEPRRVRVRVEAGGVSVDRGADLVEAVAGNLLVAALHTADEGAEVILRAARRDGDVRIEVEGPGVAAPAGAEALPLLAEAVRRLGGRTDLAPGRLAVAVPEAAFRSRIPVS